MRAPTLALAALCLASACRPSGCACEAETEATRGEVPRERPSALRGEPTWPRPRRARDPVPFEMAAHAPSGAALPQIDLPDRPQISAQVNHELARTAEALGCPGEEGASEAWRSEVEVTMAEADLLSVSIVSAYECGDRIRARSQDDSITFDLRSGEPVSFRALFEDFERDRTAIARALSERLREAPGADPELDCAATLSAGALADLPFSFALEPGGVRVTPDLPRAAGGCARRALIPYSDLVGFAAPNTPLARAADR